MKLSNVLGTHLDAELDRQPETDMPGFRLLSLSVGLLAGCGLILGALLGSLVEHFVVDGVLGIGTNGDIWMGAVVGAIVVAIIAVFSVRRMSSRMAARHQLQPSETH
jgi:hypothetical protein